MATRARIGYVKEDGTIETSYNQRDGYPSALGKTLQEHWTDTDKLAPSVAKGYSSDWGIDEESIVRNNPNEATLISNSKQELMQSGFSWGEEYIYVLDNDEWTVYERNGFYYQLADHLD